MSLSYAVIEGLSGSPVLTYHNGPKLVGMCWGNLQSRIVASEKSWNMRMKRAKISAKPLTG